MKKTKKMDGNSFNPQAELLVLLQKNFPEVFTEGRVDCEKLKKSLGENLNGNGERYGLSWAGKMDCFRHIQESTTATLKPNREESVNFDKTENLFIEGDNLQVLKILQKSYYRKVKMIYIDPPYNTGNDSFIYPDKFQESRDDYLERVGEKDEEGNLMKDGMFQKNSRDNGHYHSNWLSMMYPRLFLARNLLQPDGVIFISIDDHEVHNLRMIMNEIFGEENFIGSMSRLMKSGGNKGKFFSPNTEYILVYARNLELTSEFRLSLEKSFIKKIYTKIQEDGELKGEKYREMGLYQAGLEKRANQRYWIKCPDGSMVIPPGSMFPSLVEGEVVSPDDGDGVWRWIYERFLKEKKKGNIIFKKTKTSSLLDEHRKKSNWNIYTKIWLKDREEEGRVPTDLILKYENRLSSRELKNLEIPFDFAKPSALIKYLISFVRKGADDVILDFFAGSGTTAHAVMALNMEDRGSRKCISVQLPELCAEDSEAAKAGFKTIADIAKERIRRAGKKIATENPEAKFNAGFKVLKLDESNFKIWRSDLANEGELLKQMEVFVDNVKKESTQENILHELILKSGLDLNVQIENKKQYFVIGNGELIICLEDKISSKLVEKILSEKPQKIICLDKAFGGNDQLKTNTILQAESKGVGFKVI